MHVAVIGAGLLGVTTAYFLRRHGLTVTVLESRAEPALGASYGNGGYCQTSAPDPWNAPGVLKLFWRAWFAAVCGHADRSAFAVRTSALPGLLGWGRCFLKHANIETFRTHLIKNRHLAEYTQTVVADLVEREALDFCRSTSGGLIIFRDHASMESYAEVARYVGEDGARYGILDRDALLEKEPALYDVGDQLVGAVFFPDDSAGNPRAFCRQLAAIAEGNGVEFRYGASVRSIESSRSGVQVATSRDVITADAGVIAAGSESGRLAAALGIRLPIAPAKGYSISVPMDGWSDRPRHVIADMGVHAGINPMGDVLRVAGTAEFAGFKSGITSERTDYLIGLVRAVFPRFAETIDGKRIDPWAGLRPLSADGIPMIGKTHVDGVYVNTGHGGLGWTQAPGSSKALADLIAGVEPEFDLSAFSASRFHGRD